MVVLTSFGQVFGQVSVTPTVKSICTGSNNEFLDPIVIRETSIDDFSTATGIVSYIITLSGSNFTLSGGSINYSSTGPSDVISTNISIVSNSLQLTMSVSGANVLDVLTINGIQVNVSTGTGTIGVFSRLVPSGGTATVAGSYTNYGTITGVTTPTGGSLSPQGPFCGSGITTLSLTGVNGATSYSWGITAGTGTISGGSTSTPTLNYGTSNLTITASGINGLCTSNTLTQNITINPAPSGGTFNPVPQLCIGGGSTLLTVSGVSGATSYNWGIVSGPGTLTGPTGSNISYNYPSVGNTVVTVAGVNGGCIGNVFSQTLTVSSLPTGGSVDPFTGGNVCANSSVTLTLTGMTNGTSYVWGANLGTPTISGSGFTRTVNYGTTDFQITVIGFNGNCAASAPIGYNYFTVNPRPTTPTSSNPNSRCGNGSVTIGVFGGSGSSYNWYNASVGGVFQGNSNNLFNTPAISSTTIFYAASLLNSCESNTRLPVTASVTGSLPPPTGSSVNKCIGQPITPLTASGINLKWYADPSLTNLLASGVNTYSIPGLSSSIATTVGFYVTQSTGGGCESGILSISYTISDTTQLSLQNIGDYVCLNSTSTFTVTGFPAGGVFINSNPAYTTTLPGSTIRIIPTNFPSTLTSFSLTYRLTNNSGCTSVYSKSTNVANPIVPVVFTPPNNDKIVVGDYRIDLSSPQLANFIFLGPGNFVTNNQLNPITTVPGNFINLSVTGIDLNGCNTKGNVSYELVQQPSNLFIDLATNTSLGTSFCQGTIKRDFKLDLDAAKVPILSSVASSIPTFIDPTSVSGTGVPDPGYPDVSSLSGTAYKYFSNTPLVTSTGVLGLTTIGGTRFATGSFDPKTNGPHTIIFTYTKTSPQYTWDPVRTGKFGIPIGTNKFVYSGQTVKTDIPIVAPTINVTASTPPTFNLPTDSSLRCANSPLYSMNGSSPLINFTWTSSGTGLGPNQPAGLINVSAPFYFNPSAAGVKGGIYTITASINQSGCSSSSNQTVTVNDTTNVSFITVAGSSFIGGIPSSYCKDQQTYILDNFVSVSGGILQGTYTFGSPGGAVTNANGNNLFTVPTAKTGNNAINFTFNNTITGCTSRKSTSIRIDSAAFVKVPSIPPICASTRFLFAGTVGGVNPAFSTLSGHTWSSKFSSGGSFATTTVLNGIVRNSYLPTPTDTVNQFAWLVLTSAPTGSSCPTVSDSVKVDLNPNVQIFTSPSLQYCATDPILLTATLAGSANQAVWSVTNPGFNFSKLPPLVTSGETIQLYPTNLFLNLGGTINPIKISATPGSSASSCSTKIVSTSVQIDQKVSVSLGFSTPNNSQNGNGLSVNSCALRPINIFATVTGGRIAGIGASAGGGLWSTSGSGRFTSSNGLTSASINDTYIPSVADTTLGTVSLIFTSSILGGTVCKSAVDTIKVNFYRPPVAKASVINSNICGGGIINLIGNIKNGAKISGNIPDGTVFNSWNKISGGSIVPDTLSQYSPNKFTSSASYRPTLNESNLGASLRFALISGVPNSGVCSAVYDTVTAYISQPAKMTIIRDTTSFCAYKNGYINLKAKFNGSTPSATWSSSSRIISPQTWITSIVGLNTVQVSTYTPSPQEKITGPDIVFVLTSGKPNVSPVGSPSGTPNTCPIITDSIKLSIKTLPLVQINNVATSYCNTGTYDIITNPAVGTPGKLTAILTGPGINGSKFTPANAVGNINTIGGTGIIPITLLYSNNDGCYKDTTVYTYINPLPKVDFDFSTICTSTANISMFGKNNATNVLNTFVVNNNIINGNPIVDSISTWSWTSLSTPIIVNNQSTGVIKLTDPGVQNITLTVKSLQGCTNSITKGQTFYPYPNIDFKFSGQCLNDTTLFVDKSSTNSNTYTIGTWQWDFGDGFVTPTGAGAIPSGTNGGRTFGSYTAPKHIYNAPGIYYVKLSLITAQSNCFRRDSLKFYILPKIKPTAQGPYIQNFTSSNGGFVASGLNASWKFGTPTKTNINLTATGERAWYTGDTTYNEKENSFVDCPCFDFSDLTKPLVSLDIKRRFDKEGNDGATLLYTTGNDSIWTQVGAFDALGINWYDAPNLNSSQPGDRAGLKAKGITYPSWNKNRDSLVWSTARYALTGLEGKKSVRFRVALGSIASTKEKYQEGFAFKNFIVKERSKVILLEHFTNSSKPAQGVTDIVTPTDNQTIFEINKLNKQSSAVNILPIFYHTNFPGKDTLNALNQADPSSRTLYYGISSIPRSVLDGNFFNGPGFGQPGGLTTDRIVQRSLLDPAFGIDFDVTTTSGNVTATAIIKALTTLPSGFYSFQMSAIENILSVPGIVGGNDQKAFYYTHRKFLPDAAGTTYNKSWAKGETVNLTQTWTYTGTDRPFNPSQIGVVGFIQNIQTKEVYQVGYKVPGLAANVTEILGENYGSTLENLSLYPNPANDELTLLLDGNQISDRNWVIYDALGVPVVQGIIPASYGTATISTNNLSSGWYLLVLQPENGKKGITKKLVIQH